MISLFFYTSLVNYGVFGHFNPKTKIEIPSSATGTFKSALQSLLEEGCFSRIVIDQLFKFSQKTP